MVVDLEGSSKNKMNMKILLAWSEMAMMRKNLGGGFYGFLFSPRNMENCSNLNNMFEMGWFNHQPGTCTPKKKTTTPRRRARRILSQTLQGVKWLWYEEVVKVHELMHLGSPWGKHPGLQKYISTSHFFFKRKSMPKKLAP